MRKNMSFLSLACLLTSSFACVINDSDDAGDTTGNDDGGTADGGTADDGVDDAPATDGGTDGSTGTPTGDSTAAVDSSGGPSHAGCGWGVTGQKPVTEGYICGGEGEDPSGDFLIECRKDAVLEEGGECGQIRGEGCCDANGDVWFCAMVDDASPQLYTNDCE